MMQFIQEYTGYYFLQPNWFYLLFFLPVLLWFLFKLNNGKVFGFKFTNTNHNQEKLFSLFVSLFGSFLSVSKIIVFILLILSLTQPYKIESDEPPLGQEDYGIDLIFVLDVSLSMQAMDLQPNRLESAKNVIKNFVSERRGDRIGLVVYSGEAYHVCHKTTDHDLLISQLMNVEGFDLEQGTAIGVGLGTGVTQLRGDSTSSKAIILLTDGKNNVGEIAPMEAAELAVQEGVRVYTIGVGSNGYAPIPDMGPFGMGISYSQVEIDEDILHDISKKTGAQYFRATDSQSLENIIFEIDQIEKKLLNQNLPTLPIHSYPNNLLQSALILVLIVLMSEAFIFIKYE